MVAGNCFKDYDFVLISNVLNSSFWLGANSVINSLLVWID